MCIAAGAAAAAVGALMTVWQAVKTRELHCGVVVEKGHPDGVGDQLGMGVDWPGLMIDSTPLVTGRTNQLHRGGAIQTRGAERHRLLVKADKESDFLS